MSHAIQARSIAAISKHVGLAAALVVTFSSQAKAAFRGSAAVDQGMTFNVSRCGPGWSGGDSTYSVPLLGGKVALFSSDFFVGRVSNTDLRSNNAFVLGNALNVIDPFNLNTPMITYLGSAGGTQTRNSYTVYPYDSRCPSSSYVAPGAQGVFRMPNQSCTVGGTTYTPCVYWAGDLYVDGYLDVVAFLRRFEFQTFATGRWVGTALARVPVNDLSATPRYTELPSWHGVTYGAAVTKVVVGSTPYIYIYGTRANGEGTDPRGSYCHGNCMHLARAPLNAAADVFQWRYYAGRNTSGAEIWSAAPADTRPLDGADTTRFFNPDFSVKVSYANQGPSVNNEFSVTQFSNCGSGVSTCYVFLGHRNEPYSSEIVARWSRGPTGPWSAPVVVYRTPETAGAVFTYNSHAHAWTQSGHQIVVSYNVNREGGPTNQAYTYRPRFIRATIDW